MWKFSLRIQTTVTLVTKEVSLVHPDLDNLNLNLPSHLSRLHILQDRRHIFMKPKATLGLLQAWPTSSAL